MLSFYAVIVYPFAGVVSCWHLFFVDNQEQTWLSWKEHLFLSFFPLWGNQYNLQTQMCGRKVELWAILLEINIENHLSFALWFCCFVNLECWMISLILSLHFFPFVRTSLTKGFFAFLFSSFPVLLWCEIWPKVKFTIKNWIVMGID